VRYSGHAFTVQTRAIYDRRGGSVQAWGGADLRWLCSQAQGETLEIGIGRGRTLPFYPRHVHLSAIEISPVSLEIVARRARELGLDASLREGDAAALPYPDDHFDTVVFCFALCTIPNDRTAIAEAVRVLRPGGLLLLVEHILAEKLEVQCLERRLLGIVERLAARKPEADELAEAI
jgi:ubiquinone/menaquinone biosynthesis C-methylase UbiE